MTVRLVAVCVRTARPDRAAAFWATLLGWTVATGRTDHGALVPTDETSFEIRFCADEAAKTAKNGKHFDLTSTSLRDQRDIVARALAEGARHVDIGQGPDEPHVVLADPDGNEFCVVEAGNRFLADCGVLGAVACDGSRATGHFWSAALDWPLVWDQDDEAAVRSPTGGPKISWGDPPEVPAGDRLVFLVAPAAGADDVVAERDRLLALGATPMPATTSVPDVVALADPDGYEFWLTAGPAERRPV